MTSLTQATKAPGRMARSFTIWKTVKLGTYQTADEYREALKKVAYRISNWADDILGEHAFTCAKQEVEVDLVVASVAELGLTNGGQFKDICARAVGMGLELCPPEVGPALRLAHDDQATGEWLIPAMEAVTVGNDRGIFTVDCSNSREFWLDGYRGLTEVFWDANRRFVFVRPKR